jgi:uncharacterized protein DUF4115
VTTEESTSPRDQRAILDELERLHDAIQFTRRQRQQKAEEFDAFVKTFRGPRMIERQAAVEAIEAAAKAQGGESIPPSPPPIVPSFPPPPAPSRSARDAPGESSAPRLAALPSEAVLRELRQKVETEESEDVLRELQRRVATSEPAVTRPPRPRSAAARIPSRTLAIVVGAAVLLVIVLMLWRPWQRPASTTALPGQGPAQPATTPAGSGTTATAAPPTSRPVQLELTAARAVWLRVVADGKNVLEREVASGEVVSFGADQTIVVRAGDAGSVRVRQNGTDLGALGKDGLPTTRTFTPGARD